LPWAAIGLFTGYAAFIASGEMAVAYFQNHFPKGFWPILNTGERGLLLLHVPFYLQPRRRHVGRRQFF
jgi:putative oxidoreductase